MSALVVNLYGGPGTGKSTNAALVFGKLKLAGVRAELATEYAKDLVWEGRHSTLTFQPYVVAKQMWRIERVRDKVDVVVTDSPILLGLIYSNGMPQENTWKHFLIDVHNSWDTMDFFLGRPISKEYDPEGRNQTEEEAHLLDQRIHKTLRENYIPYELVGTGLNDEAAAYITGHVRDRLENRTITG